MPFDLNSARQAGKTDDEIANYLGGKLNFDVEAARKAGKSSTEIAQYLSTHDRPREQNVPRGTSTQDTTVVPEWGRKNPIPYGIAGSLRETLGPIAEALGFGVGGAVGATATPELFGAGALPGAGLGLSGVRQGLRAVDEMLGNKPPVTIPQSIKPAIQDFNAGAAAEAGGQVGGKAIGKTAEFIGKGFKQLFGTTTGAGPGMVEEALKGGDAFKDAMRGKVSGDEVVDSARTALSALKEQRATSYRGQLAEFSKNKEPLDITPIKKKLSDLLKQFGVRQADPVTMINTGKEFDFSRSVFGKSATRDVEEITNMISQWGSKQGDNTPLMLDTLKRRLSDFYSESSQARALVSSLENEVKKTITTAVPQYANMTKGYAEASNLIQDVEKSLLLKKGNTADQTLRRLTSAMRENFEMRRDLVNILGEKTGQDVAGQIAGYAASPIVPRGLIGKLHAGSVGYFAYLHPKFWPLLATSSPRAVGEFMNIYGKGLAEAKTASPAIYKTLAFEAASKPSFSMSDLANIKTPIGQIQPGQLKEYLFGKPQPAPAPQPKAESKPEPKPEPKEAPKNKKKYTRRGKRESEE